jgi:RNA polymerase sigma factor (sigma-70 family)
MGDYTKAPDRELIAACLDGDTQAWEALINRYRRLIHSIPYKYRLTQDDVSDVFQSVCLGLMEGLGRLRDEAKLSSWLITLTVRECWKLKQRRRRETNMDDPDDESAGWADIPADGPLPDEIIQRWQEQQLLRQGLKQLDERCQRLLRYLFYQKEEWSYEQIAQDLGMPLASIGPTRGRCLRKLRRALKNLGLT